MFDDMGFIILRDSTLIEDLLRRILRQFSL